jgi:hypothetical protein
VRPFHRGHREDFTTEGGKISPQRTQRSQRREKREERREKREERREK